MRKARKTEGRTGSVDTFSGGVALLAAAGLVLAGCYNPINIVLTNFKNPTGAADPDSVRVTTERLSTPPYLELGYVYAQAASLDEAVRQAKVRSAKVGGTTIMNARAGINITRSGAVIVFPIFDRSFFLRGIVVKEKSAP